MGYKGISGRTSPGNGLAKSAHWGRYTILFGVTVELWRIGDSWPAPHFNVVVTPNGWRKETTARRTTSTSSRTSVRGERYQAFFQSLIDTLREGHGFTNARRAGQDSWYTFSTGYGGGTNFAASFVLQHRAKVEVNFESNDRDKNVRWFDLLERSKQEIEIQLGELIWDKVEGRKACRVSLVRTGSIDDDDDTLAEIHSWMVDNLLRFKEVLGPRLASITS